MITLLKLILFIELCIEGNTIGKTYVALEYYWIENDGLCSLDPKDLPAKALDRPLAQSCDKAQMAVYLVPRILDVLVMMSLECNQLYPTDIPPTKNW